MSSTVAATTANNDEDEVRTVAAPTKEHLLSLDSVKSHPELFGLIGGGDVGSSAQDMASVPDNVSIGTEHKEPDRKCKQDHKATDGTTRLASLIDEKSMPVVLPEKDVPMAASEPLLHPD